MTLRPPSVQKERDEFYSGDPAFIQPERGTLGDEAWEKVLAKHGAEIDRARETGDWSPLLIEGQQPTKFVMRPIKSSAARTLLDQVGYSQIGLATGSALAFRASIVDIHNFGDFKLAFINHPTLGRIATEGVIDALDAIDRRIVTELGSRAIKQARELVPKS